MDTNTVEKIESPWEEAIGVPAMSAITDMVLALESDYDRLEELRGEKDDWEAPSECECGSDDISEHEGEATCEGCAADFSWASENSDDAEELVGLEAEAGDCTDRDDAEQRIHEDPLSLQVRGGWHSPGEDDSAEEFELLLGTGGPAVRIIGELDDALEPTGPRLQVQDWYKPWTNVEQDTDTLETYCRCFFFGES